MSTAAPVQPLVCLEVVPHPRGGWTIAEPVDGSRSTVRLYSGWWPSKAAARAAFEARHPYAI